jgi:hypothetical protein
MMVAFGPGRRLFAFLMVVALTTMMATLSACGSADGGQGDRQGDGSRPTTQHHASGHEAESASRTLNRHHPTTAARARGERPLAARSTR